MSRWRFPLLVVLLAIVVAAGSFALGLQLLDDGEPDAPTRAGSAADPAGATTTVAAPTTTPVATGGLTTPAWIVVVASEGSEATATSRADAIGDRGQPVGVLRSDDYPSLNPGLWVAYAGPYATADEATAVRDALAAGGVSGTYVRCAGTAQQCRDDDR